MLQHKTINVIDVSDLDDLVKEVYGKPYKLQQQNGCMERQHISVYVGKEVVEGDENEYGDIHESIPLIINGNDMCVKFDTWLNATPEQHKEEMCWEDWEVELFWFRNFYPDLNVLLYDLYKKGLIEKGSYDINIDW